MEEQKQLARRVTYPESGQRKNGVRLLRQKAAATSTDQGTKAGSSSAQSLQCRSIPGTTDMLLARSAILSPHSRQLFLFQPMFLPVLQPTAAATEPGNPKDTSSLLPAFVQVQGSNSAQREWRDVASKATLHNTTF